jgi:hypothetical protein
MYEFSVLLSSFLFEHTDFGTNLSTLCWQQLLGDNVSSILRQYNTILAEIIIYNLLNSC